MIMIRSDTLDCSLDRSRESLEVRLDLGPALLDDNRNGILEPSLDDCADVELGRLADTFDIHALRKAIPSPSTVRGYFTGRTDLDVGPPSEAELRVLLDVLDQALAAWRR